MHRTIEPKILYMGTPVVLISTLNEDGTANLAPMSSAWWLDMSCMLGLGTRGKTFENLERERECVLNLPSSAMVSAVDRLALTTGKNPVPEYKKRMGFRYVADKFALAGLTVEESEKVRPPRRRMSRAARSLYRNNPHARFARRLSRGNRSPRRPRSHRRKRFEFGETALC